MLGKDTVAENLLKATTVLSVVVARLTYPKSALRKIGKFHFHPSHVLAALEDYYRQKCIDSINYRFVLLPSSFSQRK